MQGRISANWMAARGGEVRPQTVLGISRTRGNGPAAPSAYLAKGERPNPRGIGWHSCGGATARLCIAHYLAYVVGLSWPVTVVD